jgi:hypothetical protein
VITFAKALGLPSCRHGLAGPSKAMKTRGFEALLPKLGKAGQEASRGPGDTPGGPPYFCRFPTVLQN